jgi:hypothetical protein
MEQMVLMVLHHILIQQLVTGLLVKLILEFMLKVLLDKMVLLLISYRLIGINPMIVR